MKNVKEAELAQEELEEVSGGLKFQLYERSRIKVQSIQDAGNFNQIGQGSVKPLRAR